MTRTPLALALLLGACSPPSPDYAIPLPTDFAYALPDAVRTSDTDCGDPVEAQGALDRPFGTLGFTSRYQALSVTLHQVLPDCSESEVGLLGPGEALDVVVDWGQVVRVVLPDGRVHSSWQLLFGDGQVVLQ